MEQMAILSFFQSLLKLINISNGLMGGSHGFMMGAGRFSSGGGQMGVGYAKRTE